MNNCAKFWRFIKAIRSWDQFLRRNKEHRLRWWETATFLYDFVQQTNAIEQVWWHVWPTLLFFFCHTVFTRLDPFEMEHNGETNNSFSSKMQFGPTVMIWSVFYMQSARSPLSGTSQGVEHLSLQRPASSQRISECDAWMRGRCNHMHAISKWYRWRHKRLSLYYSWESLTHNNIYQALSRLVWYRLSTNVCFIVSVMPLKSQKESRCGMIVLVFFCFFLSIIRFSSPLNKCFCTSQKKRERERERERQNWTTKRTWPKTTLV